MIHGKNVKTKERIIMKKIFLLISSLFIFCACNNDENDYIINPEPNMEYAITVNIATNSGNNKAQSTRAQDQHTGAFTAEYDADYVYIHSTTNSSKVVKLPIEKIEECDDCDGNGFRYFACKNEDGSYTIRSYNNDSFATFAADEKVYFSSEEYEIWEGHNDDENSPLTGQSVLIRDNDKNKEIYRSENNYTLQDVFNLGLNGTLTMQRKCSAFRVYFMFTDLKEGFINMSENMDAYLCTNFTSITGKNYNDFSAKVYIGPYFCDTYNINTGETGYKDGHTEGYYVTNEQKYVEFQSFSYPLADGEDGKKSVIYNGYGITNVASGWLITPYHYNSNEILSLDFYAFIKDTTENPDSDSGSKFTKYHWDGLPAYNTTTTLLIIYDVRQLAAAFNNATENRITRSFWEGPEELNIQPAKVICIQE